MWLQQLIGFAMGILAGTKAKVEIPVGVQLPKFSIRDSLNIFGHEDIITVSASGENDNIVLETQPSGS